MAITKLPTNYKDDVLDTSVNQHRRFKLTSVQGETNTYEFDDVSEYIQQGNDYSASDVNSTNSTVNALIELSEDIASDIDGLIDGSITIARATTAQTAISATTAQTAVSATSASTASTANTANSAVSAGSATNANTANTATTATTADKLTTARKINGVDFDGSGDIIIYDNTKVAKDSDFILANQTLTFVNQECTVSDNRITASSLADVFFTSNSIVESRRCVILVDTFNGYVKLTASKQPTESLVASIHIKVVE